MNEKPLPRTDFICCRCQMWRPAYMAARVTVNGVECINCKTVHRTDRRVTYR